MMARKTAVGSLAAEQFDLLVIGGGITGAGVALDAATRGLTVALVERHDFACGSSSRSSKLLHGELRERELMLELAPRLVRRLPLVALGPHAPEGHRSVSGAELAELVPALAARESTSGSLFYDCQTDDARLVLAVLAEAERQGAVCANRLEATELVRQGGRIVAVEVRDSERTGCFTIAADAVINATAVGRPESRGTHILLSAGDLPLNGAGVVMPAPPVRHVVAVPWFGRVLVGATDHQGEDIDFLLKAMNSYLGTALGRADVVGAFNGAHLTTWRQTAKRAVDRLMKRDRREAACRTDEIVLAPEFDRGGLSRLRILPQVVQEHLARRYGAAAGEVLDIVRSSPGTARPILEDWPDLLAEAVYAARHEQARSVGDVLMRRTRLGLLAAREVCDPRGAVALRVANAMAPELGWGERRAANEAAAWAREAGDEGLR
jgi:glycerol-3-phosphate dehydrogenase